MDWISALAAQDQSFEGLAAKRDLTKKIALMRDVAQMGINKQQEEARAAEREKEFGLRREDTLAQRAETSRLREQGEKDRQTTEKRNRYNTIHDNLKPGDRMKRGPDLDLMNEFGTGGQFSDAQDDPEAQIYQKHQFEQAELKRKQDEEVATAREKRAVEDQKRQDAQFKLQEQAAKRAEQTAERNKKAFDAKQKDLDAKEKALTPAGRAEAAQAAKAKLDATQKSGGFFGSDEDVANKRAEIVHAEYDRVLAKEQAAKGIGPNASTLVKPTDPNKAPGVKVEVAPGVFVTKIGGG